MATFSMGEALGAGFGLITKKPLSVLAWGVAYLILGLGPVAAMFAFMSSDLLAIFQQASNAASAGAMWGEPPHVDPAQFWRVYGKFAMFAPVLFLTSLAARAVLTGAVFRAVLEPKNQGLAYLRLGKKELWLALLFLAAGILLAMLMVALAGVTAAVCIAIVAALKAANAPAVWGGLATAVCMAAATVAFIHVCLRFSMAGPMTFAAGEFRLFESWAITKGQTLKLFGLGLVLVVLTVALNQIFQVLVMAMVFSVIGFGSLSPENVQAFLANPPANWVSLVAPWAAGLAALTAFVAAAFAAIMIAPWAVVYRSLSGGGDEPQAAPVAPSPEGHGGHDDHGGADHGHGHGHDDHGHDDHAAPDDGHGHDDHGHEPAHGHDDHGHGDHSKPDHSGGHH